MSTEVALVTIIGILMIRRRHRRRCRCHRARSAPTSIATRPSTIGRTLGLRRRRTIAAALRAKVANSSQMMGRPSTIAMQASTSGYKDGQVIRRGGVAITSTGAARSSLASHTIPLLVTRTTIGRTTGLRRRSAGVATTMAELVLIHLCISVSRSSRALCP